MPTIESRARNGAYAGVVLAILGSFTAASIIWGLLRPRYQATIIDDLGGLELNMVDNVEFTGFFWFVFTTGILAIILSARIHQKTLAYRGLSMLLWVTLWSLVGSILLPSLGTSPPSPSTTSLPPLAISTSVTWCRSCRS